MTSGASKRPRVVEGITIKSKTGCGSIYVTINLKRGRPFEVIVKLGRSGGCGAAQAEAIGRLISLALRSGIGIPEIVKELKYIRCPYPTQLDERLVTSCADAIAKVLEDFYEETCRDESREG